MVRTQYFFKRVRHALILSAFAMACIGCNSSSTPLPTPSPIPSPTNNGTPTPSPSPINLSADTYTGPYLTTESEYHLAAKVDNEVLSGVMTEAWAAVYRPLDMSRGPYPVIIMLHGNHSTCGSITTPITELGNQYTFDGTCPLNQQQIPSYLGYGYLANRLASFGYVVVSINANRGITAGNPANGDNGLVLARGRLILRHLQLLSSWNHVPGTTPTDLGVDLAGKLDFSQVGLFGHSRGGEGVRAAYNLYGASGSSWQSEITDPVTFRAVFEVGPVDGQSSMTLNAVGVAWNVILPLCDGDVSDNEGMKPFDRMLAATTESPAMPKSMFAVWGANHDFYNTYWQSSDSFGCVGATPLWNPGDSQSVNEQQTAISSVLPFFRAHLGANSNPALAAVLDPLNPMADAVSSITRVDRAYIESSNSAYMTRAETFQGAGSQGTLGQPHSVSNVTVTHTAVSEHDPSLMAGEVAWNSAGSSVYFQDNWTSLGNGLNVSNDTTLDFRVSRANSAANPSTATDFEIQLVSNNGSLGPAVSLSSYFSLVGPIGMLASDGTLHLHETLPTVRIPLSDLGAYSMGSVTGVRFTFGSTSSGDIYLSDIDLSAAGLVSAASKTLGFVEQLLETPQMVIPRMLASVSGPTTQIISVGDSVDADGNVRVEVQSSENFPVRDALPVLLFDGKEVAVGGFSDTGDLHYMIFKVSKSVIDAQPENFVAEVSHHGDLRSAGRSLGSVRKAIFTH